MAAVGDTVLTLADWAKRLDPDGRVAAIANLLSETNEILDDMMFREGNLATGHRATIQTGLPDVYWRMLNRGVPNSKSRTAQVDEQCGMLEARSEIDVDLVNLEGNSAEFRLSEGRPFTEAMNQEMASTLFYGDPSNPEEFVGLSQRYSSLSANNAQNIIDAGGTGSDNSSIWLVVWGDNTCFGIFPKGSKAGLMHEDLGVGDAFDSSNNRFRAYMDRWQWKNGLVVKDWRYVVRIANIDISNLVADSSAADLFQCMAKALHRIPQINMGRAAFYCNRTIAEYLDIQSMGKASSITNNVQYMNAEDAQGKMVQTFRRVPIRTCDALTETEARVT